MGDILVPYYTYKNVVEIFKKENQNFILVTNYTGDPYKGGAIYCKNDLLQEIIEKPPKGKSKSNLNNCGIFIFSTEIFDVLKSLNPSERGELELTEAIMIGVNSRKWKIRIIKMEKNQFRGDFGDIKVYEKFYKDSTWLSELFEDNKKIL